MTKINVFNGYYEVFICKGFLKNPYSFRFSGAAEEIEDFLSDFDDHVFVENGLDFIGNGTFENVDGLPVLTGEEF